MNVRSIALRGLAGVLVLLAVACGSDQVRLTPGDAVAGAGLYRSNCAGCHGEDGQGAAAGPPLVHALYAAPDFTDEQLARAIREGAAQDNWRDGSMPGFRALSDRDISDIVSYVRQLQGG